MHSFEPYPVAVGLHGAHPQQDTAKRLREHVYWKAQDGAFDSCNISFLLLNRVEYISYEISSRFWRTKSTSCRGSQSPLLFRDCIRWISATFHQSLLSSVGLERLTVIVQLSSEGPLFDSERGDFFLSLHGTRILSW